MRNSAFILVAICCWAMQTTSGTQIVPHPLKFSKSDGKDNKRVLKIVTAEDVLNHPLYLPSLNTFLDIESSMDGLGANSPVLGKRSFHSYVHIISVMLKLAKAATYLEIGSFCGASLALALSDPDVKIAISLDLDLVNTTSYLIENSKRFNVHNTKVHLLSGDSHDSKWPGVIENLLGSQRYVDVLFIDGDHSSEGAVKDFEMYHRFLRRGGFLIWDDYLDRQWSPGVKLAVDLIKEKYKDCYNSIGTIQNIAGAGTLSLEDRRGVETKMKSSSDISHKSRHREVWNLSNEFIMQKRYRCGNNNNTTARPHN